ncbi:MAG TPA: helicase-related protein [Corynebacterium sp.]|nr:helicase-related protein [Corynebacterium sp.]
MQSAGGTTITYRRQDNSLSEVFLFPEDLDGLSVSAPVLSTPFTGDPRQFRIAAEALRIRTAGLHDPMSAVTSSEIQPLPHQIRAVYEEMLPRIPLRFLLADDPGAGKTIMTGLYLKELLLRGDVQRCLIVCPGGLAIQWQEELREKFGLRFHILPPGATEASPSGNPFHDHDLLIVRMDAVARSEDDLLPLLENSTWDLAVVDEAHRMSAVKGFRQELRKTKRFQLGESLREVTRNLLLLTATPHNGDNEAFQAFLSLLDPDRFEGAFQTSTPNVDTTGLMRRMVKEELLTFEGRPLFPERRAVTVPYTLSGREMELYELVTGYVREEMNRAEASLKGVEGKAVGFALTVLQRRLASSPWAILRSLERRKKRLEELRTELNRISADGVEQYWDGRRFSDARIAVRANIIDDLDFSAAESEEAEEATLVSPVTAARSLAELELELATLTGLVNQAQVVAYSGEDRKWAELSRIIQDEVLHNHSTGDRRKLIIFTEHRDTLDYLCRQIGRVTGEPDSVVSIHGGTSRLERQRIRENFTHDGSVQFLVATDAAGEGLNLQAAYLMVNYDLPWNPNRIEQRFGRIHRIGQKHVCLLWNLVADETREGQVYTRLLQKMETQRAALGTRVFDVLGDAFQDRPLRELMMDAVRYIDDPARMEEINRVIDEEVSRGLDTLLEERALAAETLGVEQLQRMREQMDEARARRLQPHYISRFFHTALQELGGRTVPKAGGTAAIRRVPNTVLTWARQRSLPVADRYDRITFDPTTAEQVEGAELLAPGHALLDAVVEVTLERLGPALHEGTVLVDPTDDSTEPWLLVAASLEIRDGTGTTQAAEFSYVRVNPDGTAGDAGPAPYLDFDPLPEELDTTHILEEANHTGWLTSDPQSAAKDIIAAQMLRPLLAQTKERIIPELERVEKLVSDRLIAQQNYLAGEAAKAQEQQRLIDSGEATRPPSLSYRAYMDQVVAMNDRLQARRAELQRQRRLTPTPPRIKSTALIIPRGLLEVMQGADESAVSQHAKDTREVERRAVDAVLAAERALGREPTEMPHNNPGYDIISRIPGSTDPAVIIEVKGRISGSDTFTLTHREALTGKNTEKQHRLVLVDVSPDGPDHDQLRYLVDYCRGLKDDGMDHAAHVLKWRDAWEKGGAPV